MFRHKETTTDETVKSSSSQEEVGGVAEVVPKKVSTPEAAKPEASLKELIEKNLKWSQIIYEQNRKINNKLLWTAVASWLRLFLIAVPLILAIVFLPSLFKGFMSQYGDLLGNSSSADTQTNSIDNLLKLFNLDPAKQEQLKALLK